MTRTVLVYPDEIKVNGDMVSGIVYDLDRQEKEAMTCFAKSAWQARQFRQLIQPTRWTVTGQVQPLLPHTNENQFDPQQYYHQRQVCNQLRVRQVSRVEGVPVRGFWAVCHCIRQRLNLFFSRLPSPLNAYCQQLIIGQRGSETAELLTSVKKLGLLHLFCISGMHIVLLTSLTRKLLVHLWWDRAWIDACLIVILPFYLIIGGGATSLVRATIMAEMGLLHRYLPLDALDGWAISLLVGLALDPLLLFTLGGQLTYLLSFMLQVLPTDLTALNRSLLLNFASLPSILSFVYEFHTLSLVVSYIVMPFFATVVFPAVLLGALCFKFLPGVTAGINAGLQGFQRLLDWLATLPGMIHFGKPPLLLGILLFSLTLVALQDHRCHQPWQWLLVAYIVVGLVIHFPVKGEVTFVDIGQGDAIIIREPFNRQVLMIDTGGKLAFHKPDWAAAKMTSDDAQRITINYLKSKGISQLDTLYLSHQDADHLGYLPTIVQGLQVKRVVVPAGLEKQRVFTNKVRTSLNPNLQVVPVTATAQPPASPLQVLHPFVPGEGKNEDSMVLAGKFGGKSFVFTGDLDRENECKVAEKYPQLRADILKAGHHGSKTASDPRFLAQLAPKYAIISAGRFNRYHHPHQETITNLRKKGIIPLSTQQFGMIQYEYYGKHGTLKTTVKGDELKWTLPSYLSN